MPLLNYTTTINPDRTVGEIQRILASHGVSHVVVQYGSDRVPASMAFRVQTRFGSQPFRLPANIGGIEAVLVRQYKQGKVSRRLACREQAARVGWRILLEWIRAQLAIVEAGMVTLEEVMLPYLVGDDERTLYQVMVDRHLALPAPGDGKDGE